MTDNGWLRAEQLVMHELEEHGKKLDSIDCRLRNIESQVAGLKVRVSIWAAAVGGITSLAVILGKLLL